MVYRFPYDERRMLGFFNIVFRFDLKVNGCTLVDTIIDDEG